MCGASAEIRREAWGVKRCDATSVPHPGTPSVCRRRMAAVDARKKLLMKGTSLSFMQQGGHESDVAWTGRAEEK